MSPRLWLCLPPVALCLIDHALTMGSQPAAYWAGDYAAAREANEGLCWLMRQHPLAIHAALFAWLGLVGALVLALPRRPALLLALAVTIGHTFGAATWLHHTVTAGYWLAIGLCLVSAALVVVAVECGLAAPPGETGPAGRGWTDPPDAREPDR
jgi:hypothetical protein